MKKVDLIFASATIPLDWCMVVGAGIAAYFLRFQTLAAARPIIYQIPFDRFIVVTIIGATFMVILFALSGLYTIRARKIHNEIQRVITSCSTGMMALIVGIFFFQEYFSSRFVILVAWLLMIAFISLERGVLRIMRRHCSLNGIGIMNVALIGDNSHSQDIADYITRHPETGMRTVAHIHQWNSDSKNIICDLAKHGKVDELIVVQQNLSCNILESLLDFALVNHLDIRYSTDTYGLKRFDLVHFAGIPFILVKRTRLNGWMRIIKRMIDCFFSLILIVIFLPLIIIIALFIKLQSMGPILYKDIRVGQRGTFVTYKFRTMYIEYCTGAAYDKTGAAEQFENSLIKSQNERKGPVPKVLRDPRRTPIGRILEATSLDELPQFFNVFIGTMSLVGPRPHRPKEVSGYDIGHHQLFSVKPGITGLAQISGRSDLHFDEEVRLDLFYIENWSLLLDAIIMLKTPYSVFSRKSRV